MAESKIIKTAKNTINQLIATFAVGNGPEPADENTYPRCELRSCGPTGSREVGLLYLPDSNTTYFNILTDASGRPGFGSIRTGWVTVTLAARSNSVAITAPYIQDFDFVCWLGAASQGSIKPGYIENMVAVNSRIWTDPPSTSDTIFNAFALYRKGLSADT